MSIAIEGVDRGLDDGLASLGGRHAVVVGDRLSSEVPDLLGNRLGRSDVGSFAGDGATDVVDDDARPAGRQQQGMLFTQAPAGAGDDRHLPVKTEITHGRRG